jgi:hypothetical protein
VLLRRFGFSALVWREREIQSRILLQIGNPKNQSGGEAPPQSRPDQDQTPNQSGGEFGHERTVTFADVKDGTSCTLLLLETQRNTGPWAAGGSTTLRGIDSDDEPPIGKEGAFGYHAGATRWNFGRVPTKAISVMADGSARTIPAKVDATMLEALATIAGRESVVFDW